MNVSSQSPALTLLYVFALLWILMDVDLKKLSRIQRLFLLPAFVLLCSANQILSILLGPRVYGKLLILSMHLPTFLFFLFITKRGIIKTAFMILTAMVFSAPPTIVANILKNHLGAGEAAVMVSNVSAYILMLLLAQFVFRKSFRYVLMHSNNRFFLLFSLVPLMYYIYILTYINIDISALVTPAGFVVRLLPNLQVFCFYFLLPYIYRSLSEKHATQSAQYALQQKLASTQEQIDLLNETNTQMAVYRHDMRHQIIVLAGLLAEGKTEQAQDFVKAVQTDLDAITPKQFCENGTVNLLCASYDRKAQRRGVQLTIRAIAPENLPLSDTELCSVVSNGLENALLAASDPALADKRIDFLCEVKQNKLFIQIQNTYSGQVIIRDGLPVSSQDGHGYGCHSIQTIVQRNGGHCSFEAENGLFSLRLFVPFPEEPKAR